MIFIRNIFILVICISSFANAQSNFLKKEGNSKTYSQGRSAKNHKNACDDILNASPPYNKSQVSSTARIAGYFLGRVRFKISKSAYSGGELEEVEEVTSEEK